MAAIFRVELSATADEPGAVVLAWTDPENRGGEELIGAETVRRLQESSLAFMRERSGSKRWVELAWKLYDVLNTGACELERFHGSGRPPLELRIRADGNTRVWPFELIRMIFDIRIIREIDTDCSCSVSDLNVLEDRMLLLMFMACAPQYPGDESSEGQLYFEKEEEAIFEATKSGAVELDVEDTGSLNGLAEKLREEKFDVVHISCHANIDEGGPYLCMETDVGELHKASPEALWENCLKLRPPHIVFLSACRSGESGGHEASSSFCESLVARGLPMAIGWGISVADPNATRASQIFYGELALGVTALEAVEHTREKLISEGDLFWPFLRVFVSPEVTDFAIVSPPGGRKRLPKRRTTKLKQLGDAGMNVLLEGFVGRRREIQKGLRALRDTETAGIFIHGAGGLGKSCLAGRLVERFSERNLIVVNGVLNEETFTSALLKGFNRAKNLAGIRMLKDKGVELADKIPVFCSTEFSEASYIILLDDFERNIVVEYGEIKGITEGAGSVLDPLIENLPECLGVTKLIITSRYRLPLEEFEYI
ncbi:MAG: CHAT domain-containing protein, partial [bacterium]